ncbi:N-6 DNA methylase [Alicyclobacillus cycloheptanicus]|uniref:SAM-dependent methyltransferase n=1 Tax=Alicyclobacillus cycloheptanicus TaxID=1457 RepID=A0ABT9XHQ5_9BACL|nr:N-6 DNA methylase [Alicyclobacillus cycloheptanicus]MDQ0189823.1 SAM-dependent methyltransferase [Alicyclobacillus cycloheptanicus]WDM02489.1 N-6 DNA methylase [Alicyclobacillus cycloheptanicus]
MIDLRGLGQQIRLSSSQLSIAMRELVRELYFELKTAAAAPSAQALDAGTMVAATSERPTGDDPAALYAAWRRDFIESHGNIEGNPSSNAKVKGRTFTRAYGLEPPIDIVPFVFATQTAFSLLVRLIAHNTVAHQLQSTAAVPGVPALEDLPAIMDGRFFRDAGIDNYCSLDAFCWFLTSTVIDRSIQNLLDALYALDTLPPAAFYAQRNVDHIKQVYETLFPRQLRHALGEYYTPDWLAEYTLQEALAAMSERDPSTLSFLDPACGSGTFLVMLVDLLRALDADAPAQTMLHRISTQVRGYDINALAVLTARTNLLMSIADLLDGRARFALPVEMRDAIQPSTGAGAAERPKVDVIVGNPPWINWEYLSPAYKRRSQHLWYKYGLFDVSGRDLAFSKEDISVLMTYAVIDHDLKDGGVLAFVIRQGVFKSKQNGVGFRRFRLGQDGTPVKVLKVDDLSRLRAFDNATNSTAVVLMKKGTQTTYPVPYHVWTAPEGTSPQSRDRLGEVMSTVTIEQQLAQPAEPDDATSVWLTLPKSAWSVADKVLGANTYRARTGTFTGGANAVYWVQAQQKLPNGNILITNLTDRAKRAAAKVTAEVEPGLIYPLLRGSDVQRWAAAPAIHLLCPHTAATRMAAIRRVEMMTDYPKTYAYLEQFRDVLAARKGFTSFDRQYVEDTPYAIQRVGEYTFSRYKVVWRYIAKDFICAVISTAMDPVLGEKLVLPNEKLMYISTDDEAEAYYLCGVLSATPVSACVQSFMNPTSISTHILQKLRIPTFNPNDARHQEIARLCQLGHQAQARGETVEPLNVALDEAVCGLYGITWRELAGLRREGSGSF